MDIVAMGTNNPMMVEYYTYKVEFQERGAGHVHGTLWLKLDKLDRLIRQDNGQLVLDSEKNEQNEDSQENKRPFKGISSAFKKLKNCDELSAR